MNEREDELGAVLADPDTLLGMLQRGRGKGYLVAMETPPREVWPLLMECITNDPHSDGQCGPEGEYYASLILKTGIDLEPLQSFVRHNDDQGDRSYLALETLQCLAHRRSAKALEFLREYVQHGSDFERITWIVHELARLEALNGIDETLYRRISGSEDIYAVFREDVTEAWTRYCASDEEARQTYRLLLPVCEPWKSLCHRHGGLAELFMRVGLPYDHPSTVRKVTDADVAGLSVDGLLASVDKTGFFPSRRAILAKVSAEDEDCLLRGLSSDNRYRAMLAFCGLGKVGTPKAFETVRSYIEASEDADSGVRRAAFDAIEQMPGSLTLETARQWFGRKEWYLQVAAGCILEHHAKPEDISLLIQALHTPETIKKEDFRLPFALRALAGFEGLGRIPELEQIFCGAGDCYDRGDAAKAMAITAPDFFTDEYAFECLWDCDWLAYDTGCAMVDLSTPGALERLSELTADEDESNDVREAAQKRIDGF